MKYLLFLLILGSAHAAEKEICAQTVQELAALSQQAGSPPARKNLPARPPGALGEAPSAPAQVKICQKMR